MDVAERWERNGFVEREGTLSAASRYESWRRLCVHRVPPAHKRCDPPTPLRIAEQDGKWARGVRKGMFYNELNQRRALTLAARTNGVGPNAWKRYYSSYRISSFSDSRARKHFFGFIAAVKVKRVNAEDKLFPALWERYFRRMRI